VASNPSGNLERARQLVEARQDTEALKELQTILASEATNSEAHYLRGQVLQRRNELEAAVSAYQSAIYWNPRHIAGHLALGRLFLARNDRALALTHARQALQIEPQNRDAIALKQQIETGR
jgi:tetratricopeptide (TPR) repeat protein